MDFPYLDTLPDDAEIIYRRADTAVKFIGEPEQGRVGGYLVVWGNENERDLQGEYFTPESDLMLDWYDKRPVLYHHALDDTMKSEAIGFIDTLKADNVGVWAEAQLDLHNAYIRKIYELVKQGILGWSSGSLPHIVEVVKGWIKRWPIVEGSLTPAPALPFKTKVSALKTAISALEQVRPQDAEEQRAREQNAGKAAVSEIEVRVEIETEHNTPEEVTDPMSLIDIIKQFLQSLVEQGLPIPPDQIPALADQIVALIQPQQEAQAEPVPAEAMAATLDAAQPIIMKAVGEFLAAREAQAQAVKAAAAKTAQQMRQAPPINNLPGFTGNGNGRGTGERSPRYEMKDRRFDHLKATDMALGYLMLKALGKQVSNDYQVAMAYKTAQLVERGERAANDLAVKSVFPFLKADEVMQTDLAGFGAEYVHTYFSTDVWEQVRQETVVYERMRSLGMDEMEVPAGYKSDTVPLEGDDMTWYVAGGATDEDANTGQPKPTYSSSKFGTGQKEITVAKLSTRTNWQRELEEDSIVDVVQEANRKIRISGREQIEMILINGDTATGANTNINLIDGTPAAAPNQPAYTLLDGLAKLPLVTNTSNTYDAAGALSEAVYLSLMPLLGDEGKYAADPERILFIIDNSTYFASLNLAVLKTQDVFPSATIENGVLRRIWGVEVLRSAQFKKAQATGKVSGTPGNNTLGRILLVRPDQWAARWKRQIETFTTFTPRTDTTELVAHMRWGLGYRDNEAAAIARNVSIAISAP